MGGGGGGEFDLVKRLRMVVIFLRGVGYNFFSFMVLRTECCYFHL